ncbi:hypothetical protein [Halomicrobium salinisoli]|uniref:hypothetical protein n=1 Tax=Halomicrobium salinisoli TaxID=2878391 RepID=UPI001CF04912|nr:hypothetical protein [Halomicrobium salinisoli]
MPSESVLTPARRDALRACLAIALLAGPLWASLLHLGDPSYRYERVELTTEGEKAIDTADPWGRTAGTPVSQSIACIDDWARVRTCAFERHLANGSTVPTGWSTSNPEMVDFPPEAGYEYVVVRDQVYEIDYVVNESAREGGDYSIDLALEPVPAEDALDNASIDGRDDPDSVPDPVLTAARTGSAVTDRDVDVPKDPILTGDGRYYRVYKARDVEPSSGEQFADVLLTYVAPVVGLIWIGRLFGRVEVEYVGNDTDTSERSR